MVRSSPAYPTRRSREPDPAPAPVGSPEPARPAPRRRREPLRIRIGKSLVADRALRGDAQRIVRALVLLVLGLGMVLGAAVADTYLHRGIETSAEPPYVMQVSGRDLATNVDLRQFPAAQLESIAETIRGSGFGYIRHPFSWAEMEPEQGAFNWDHYDNIVRAFNDQGISIVATISESPTWARDESNQGAADAPPANMDDFEAFLEQFMNRYGQFIQYVQIWDRPNQPGLWGDEGATATDYLGMLATGFNVVRTNNPDTRVVMAEFDPYGRMGVLGDDVRFLTQMYEANAKPFFDVIAAKVDGGTTSPYDRRVRGGMANLSRAVLFRDTVKEFDDDNKPIWLTHYGWDTSSELGRDMQAEYLVAGIERMRAEWPWVGLAFQWELLPPEDDPEVAGRALLNPDGTATVAFSAVTGLAAEGVGSVAPTGFVPMDTGPVTYDGAWADQHLTGRIFKTTSEIGASASLWFEGTGITVYLRRSPDAGLIRATIDGEPLPNWEREDGASIIDLTYFQAEDIAVTLATDLDDGEHEIVLTLAEEGQLTMGGAVVSRDPPMLWPVVVGMLAGLVLAVLAMRELVYVIARRNGWLLKREGVDLRPSLPQLPDWQPARRA